VIWNITRHNTCTTTYYLVNNFLTFLFLFFPQTNSTILIAYGLISHSQIACSFFSFSIAKATHEDASNPIVSSETNLNIGRVLTARNREQLVCKDVIFMYFCAMVRSKMSVQNWRLRRTITKGLEQKIRCGFWISYVFWRIQTKVHVWF